MTRNTIEGSPNTPTLLAASAVAFLAVGNAAFGQAANDVTVNLGNCVDLELAEERFACYEAQVNAVLEQQKAEVETAASQPLPRQALPVPSARASDVSRPPAGSFGRPEETGEGGAPGAAAGAEDTGSGDIFATVADFREIEPDSYVITMANGQVWRQTAPKRYRLTRGLEVRIYDSNWGSSKRMTAVDDGGGFIQVRRVR